MSSFTIRKYHGLGNDYLVIDPNKCDVELKEPQIRKMCKRNFGIGADGILYGPIIEDGRMFVRCFNPDGSEAKKSGTGVRIFAKYLLDEGYTEGQKVVFDTIGGPTEVEFLNEDGTLVRAKMGKADFHASAIPVTGPEREVVNESMQIGGKDYQVTCLSVGNPNCCLFTEEISRQRVLDIGPQFECAPMFPDRVNFLLVHVVDRSHIAIEGYERGAGYTLATGTGACAAAAAAHRLGLVDKRIIVQMPGGELTVEMDEDETIVMTGTVGVVGMMMLSENFFV